MEGLKLACHFAEAALSSAFCRNRGLLDGYVVLMELLEGGLQLRDTRDGGLLDTGETLGFLSRFHERAIRKSVL